MPKLIESVSTQSETIALPYGSDREMSSIVFQVKGTGWTGTLKLQSKVRGAASVPYTDYPYQDLTTLADVAAGTTITVDGKFATRADLQEFQLVHVWTAGSVAIAARDGRG